MIMRNKDFDPKKLMLLAKEGDKDAFEELYREYFVPIFRYIYYRISDKKEAEDLTQTVFIKVYGSIYRFEDKNYSPLSYFFSVARTTVIDYWRKKKPVFMGEEEERKLADSKNFPTETFEHYERSKLVNQAIMKLTEEQQEVIIMRFINEMTYREIAFLLDKSEEAVRQLQFRALKNLKTEFKDKKLI